MRAYKCDICDNYCDDVFVIKGIAEQGILTPVGHRWNGTSEKGTDCCTNCYNEIMKKIASMRSWLDTDLLP